jgi:hypothetical protein
LRVKGPQEHVDVVDTSGAGNMRTNPCECEREIDRAREREREEEGG